MSKKPAIKLTNRDFETIRKFLEDFEYTNYPEISKDSNLNSFKSLLYDQIAALGAQFSLNLDFNTNETFLDTAISPNNILRLGKSYGYQHKKDNSSSGILTFYISVPALTTGIGPNTDYLPILKKGSEFSSTGGNNYILAEDVNFGDSSNEQVIGTVSNSTGLPTSYIIRAYGYCISGEIREEFYSVGDFTKFLKVPLNNKNVIEVLFVEDSEGHVYKSVDYLSQDVVYESVINRDATTNELVKNILKVVPVPRRFVLVSESGRYYLQFGQGSSTEIDDTDYLDPSCVVLDRYARSYISDTSFDPNKLIKSDKLGIAPVNTTLRIVYRSNNTVNSNAAVGTITNVISSLLDFGDESVLDQTLLNNVRNSLEVDNDSDIVGDVVEYDSKQLKTQIKDYFATQDRAVTRKDYISLVYRLPQRFGSIKRVNVTLDNEKGNRKLNLYVVSQNAAGNLVRTNNVIKNNLAVWLSNKKMINDSIDIYDAKIINIGLKFVAISDNNFSVTDLYSRIMIKLKEELSTKMMIGEPFDIGNIYRIINRVSGVLDTTSVGVYKKAGDLYSDIRFNTDQHITQDGRYLDVPNDSILEIKYPNLDIIGVIK